MYIYISYITATTGTTGIVYKIKTYKENIYTLQTAEINKFLI